MKTIKHVLYNIVRTPYLLVKALFYLSRAAMVALWERKFATFYYVALVAIVFQVWSTFQ